MAATGRTNREQRPRSCRASLGIVRWQPSGEFGGGEPVIVHTLSRDGRMLAASLYDNSIALWDFERRRRLGQPLLGRASWTIALTVSPDGHTLAAGTQDGAIVLWDIGTVLRLGHSLNGHAGRVLRLAFSPDGRTLASAGDDGLVLWDFRPESWVSLACAIARRNLTMTEWRAFVGTAIPYARTCSGFGAGDGAPGGAAADQ